MVSELIQKRMIACSQNGAGIAYSDDFGTTFATSNITTGSFDKPVYTHNGVCLARALGNGAEGIYRSIDGGENWVKVVDSGMYKALKVLSDGSILTSSIISGKPSLLSTDEGMTWKTVSELEERTLTAAYAEEYLDNTVSSKEGRNLMSVLHCSSIPELASKLKKMGDNDDYFGLHEGDYFDLPSFVFKGNTYTYNSQYQNLRLEIAGLGIYKNKYAGYTDNSGGVLFQCKNVPFTSRMEASNANGNTTFEATELGKALADSVNGLEETLGVSLRSVKRYYAGNYNSGVGSTSKIFLPTEIEVFGRNCRSALGLYQYNMEFMWPIFAKNPQRRCKKFDGSRKWWWECSPASTSGCFCDVDNLGHAGYTSASNADGGVPFACYI